MSKTLGYTIAAALLVVVGYVAGTYNNRAGKGKSTYTDTTTVVVYDTIRISSPARQQSKPTPRRYFTKTVPTLLAISDTIEIPYYLDTTLVIPIHQHEYAGDNYRAWVSGFEARLDSISIFAPVTTQYIDRHIKPKSLFAVNAAAGIRHSRTTDVFAGLSLRYERYQKFAVEATTGISAGLQGAGLYIEGRISVPIFTAGH